MEPTGLAIGVLALAGLFNNAVDCFNYVQTGKSFEKDLGTSLLHLSATALKLSRWGQSLGLNQVEDAQQRLTTEYTDSQVETACRLLEEILAQFEDIKQLVNSVRIDAKIHQSGEASPEDRTSTGISTIVEGMRQLCDERISRVGLRRKAKWVLYRKGYLETLIQRVSRSTDYLVELFPAVRQRQLMLCEVDAHEMMELDVDQTELQSTQQAIRSLDSEFADALARALTRRRPPQVSRIVIALSNDLTDFMAEYERLYELYWDKPWTCDYQNRWQLH